MSLSPDHIMAIGSGYGVSKALLSAVGLGLYSRLAEGPMSLAEITAAYRLHERPAMDWLDCLVSVNLLARDGVGPDAVYSNTPETAAFLDRAQPNYLGGILELWEKRNYRFWADLTEAMQTATAQNETKAGGTPFFETLYAEPDRLRAFMDAMTGSSLANFMTFADKFPFERYTTLVDIGGADALLSRQVAARHPHMRCATYDLAPVTDIARAKVAEAGLSDRIEAKTIDFFAEPIPTADVVTMGMILHDWPLDKKKALIAKAYDALPDGGAFVAIEAFIDDDRRENTYALFMSLTMLLEFGNAFDFTGAEFETWCREAGFTRFESYPLVGPSAAKVAYK